MAGEFVLDNPYCALFIEQGLGKTRTTLWPIPALLAGGIDRVLVIAPKRVANHTWPSEIRKWPECAGLQYSVITGSAKQRQDALNKPAHIYIINRENVPWLVAQYRASWPFDMVVVDESSSFKSSSTKRWKALASVRPYIDRLVLLSGTPTPNGLLDLWSQAYLLDMGERLGRRFWTFRMTHFESDYMGYKWVLREGREKVLLDRLSDICLTLRAEDYIKLPPRIVNDIYVDLPANAQRQYEELQKDFVLRLHHDDITAANAAVVVNKLLQISNGCVYGEHREFHMLHDAKLEALDSVLEEACGAPVLVAYNFKTDLQRIQQRYKFARALNCDADIDDWNAGKIQLLCAHPASAGHGLNLQHGGHILAWFGLPWSLELYEQMNARLYRSGQEMPVFIHHIIGTDTADETVLKVLGDKGSTQVSLLNQLKRDMGI